MKLKKLLNSTKKRIIGNNAIHYKHYQVYDNIYIIILKCIILGILGLVLGVIINDIVTYVSHSLNIKNKLALDIIQITLCAIVVGCLHYSHNFIGWTLQNTIPGIFFIALLFDVQLRLAGFVQESCDVKNTNANEMNNK
jgi:hypothetical protein